ncbi:hypothetical protein GOP47_0024786 [Adiantum capillus-veneris]|uniref:Cyclic nucleotide-binding domain-containing protein n=1 Tax=Adiantum capillus-veneris TaxID=13818 RepID=A0A9D4U2E5_ADICA|nr:hypothetical protein GOP47_0024786 [Adiantum capillus-veneris]
MGGAHQHSPSLTFPVRAADELQQQDNRALTRGMRTHEHLLISGPLAKCNDPFCTTCDAYLVHSAPPNSSSPWVSNVLFDRAKNVQSRLEGWSKLYLLAVVNPHTKTVQKWNQFFVIACLIGIFLDPLFFLLFSVKKDFYCISFSTTFAKVVTVLRSITDFIYFLHMLLQFKLALIAPTSNTSGLNELIDDPKEVAYRYLRGWFLIDFIAVLPLPQLMLWVVVPHYQGRNGNANVVKNILRVTLLLQYVPRCVRIFPLVAGHSQIGFIFETAWANFAINLFMYLLAGHVVGACWYLFGLQRVNYCLQHLCEQERERGCQMLFLDCGDGRNLNNTTTPEKRLWMNQSRALSSCLTIPTTDFAYGIYGNAVPVTMTSNFFAKYFYSLFWGFLQISTFAGNLVPSLFVWEVMFTMGIIGLGLLLFALLIGNVQNFLQSLGRRQMDMQLRRYDVELWMKRRNLAPDLRRKVRQAERYKWATSRGVDEDQLLGGLPEDLHKEIRRELALEYVKKVRIFKFMEDDVLDAILERLQQKVYIERSVIMRPHYPVEQMLFILRGNLVSIGDDGSTNKLDGGSFCGEELLIHSLKRAAIQPDSVSSRSKLKVFSERKVECLTNVEAFSLKAEDLEFVVNHFSRHMRNPKVQGAIRYESPYFKTLAARRIQAAWKARRRGCRDSARGDLTADWFGESKVPDVEKVPQRLVATTGAHTVVGEYTGFNGTARHRSVVPTGHVRQQKQQQGRSLTQDAGGWDQ